MELIAARVAVHNRRLVEHSAIETKETLLLKVSSGWESRWFQYVYYDFYAHVYVKTTPLWRHMYKPSNTPGFMMTSSDLP